MKKNSYIINNGKLYRITSIQGNYIKVIPATKKLTKKMSADTYYQSQLEAIGYTIGRKRP